MAHSLLSAALFVRIMSQLSTGVPQPSSQQTVTSFPSAQPGNIALPSIVSDVDGENGFLKREIKTSMDVIADGPRSGEWGFKMVYPFVTRDIWDGSDEFEECIDTVCQNVTIPLDTLCQPNGSRHRDQYQQWTCEFCWPNRSLHESAIQYHCTKVGHRAALMLHMMLGLLLGCITLSLLVWAFFLFCESPRRVKKGQEMTESCNSNEKKTERKPKRLTKKRPRNHDGLVPIMPPAQILSPSKQSPAQVDGNATDIELGLLPEFSLRPTRSATRAVSSSIEYELGSVASRTSSASNNGAPEPNYQPRA